MLQKAPRIEGANNIGNVAEHTIAILYFMPEHYVMAEEMTCEKEMARAKYMDALCSAAAARGRAWGVGGLA